MRKKDSPDNYVPNAYAIPYASSLSSPVIKPNNLGGWKMGAVHSANQHYEERFEELRKNLQDLAEEVKWNEVVFNAEMKFKPIVGKEYHLYKRDSSKYFLSLFAPNECSWGKEWFKGSFILNSDNRWKKKNL